MLLLFLPHSMRDDGDDVMQGPAWLAKARLTPPKWAAATLPHLQSNQATSLLYPRCEHSDTSVQAIATVSDLCAGLEGLSSACTPVRSEAATLLSPPRRSGPPTTCRSHSARTYNAFARPLLLLSPSQTSLLRRPSDITFPKSKPHHPQRFCSTRLLSPAMRMRRCSLSPRSTACV